jgi:hypothetical protein
VIDDPTRYTQHLANIRNCPNLYLLRSLELVFNNHGGHGGYVYMYAELIAEYNRKFDELTQNENDAYNGMIDRILRCADLDALEALRVEINANNLIYRNRMGDISRELNFKTDEINMGNGDYR